MAKEVVRDWTVQVQMDTSLVDKGAKRVERIMGRLAKMQAKLGKGKPINLDAKVKINLSDFEKQLKGLRKTTLVIPARIRVEPPSGRRTRRDPPDSDRRTRRDPPDSSRRESRRSRTEQANLRATNSLESKRLQLLRAIERAKDLGLQTRGFSQSLRGGNVLRVEQRRLELERMITKEKRKQKEAAERARVAAERAARRGGGGGAPFQLADDRQLRLANTIDSVVRRAGRSLGENSEAFRDINRRAERLRATISRVGSRSGLERLNNQIRLLRERTTAASSAANRLSGNMNSQSSSANRLVASMGSLGRAYLTVFAAVEAGRVFFQTGAQFDSLNASLLAASGSTEAAAADFEFIKQTSLKLGVGLSQVADGYRQIGAAGRFSNLTVEQTKDVFLAATESSRAFGLSADRAKLVFLAFSQILSKGKVSQEELRRQLGEQLPGVMAIAAKSMNATTGEFEDMIRAGISAEEFLPKFSKELRKAVTDSGALAASLKSITAAQQRFTTAFQLLTVEAFDVGAKKGEVGFFNSLARAAKTLRPLFRLLGKAVGVLGVALGFTIEVVAQLFRPLTTLADILVDVTSGFLTGSDSAKVFNGSADELSGKLDDGTDKVHNFNDAFGGLGRILKIIAGLFLLPIGALERFFDLFEKFRDLDFGILDSIIKASDEVNQAIFDFQEELGFTFGKTFRDSVNSALKSVGVDFSFGGQASMNAITATTPSTVNSGNTISVAIDATGSDTTDIVERINETFQDIFKVAVPTN